MDDIIIKIFIVNFRFFKFKLYFHLILFLLTELKVTNYIIYIILYYHFFQIIYYFSKYGISLVFIFIKLLLNYRGV